MVTQGPLGISTDGDPPVSTSSSGHGERRQARGRWWVLPAAAVLAAGCFAVGVVVGRAADAPPPEPPDLASAEVRTMLAARVEAVNAGDEEAVASFYAADAVLEELDQRTPIVTRTSADIATHLRGYQELGFRLEQTGTPTQLGPFVSEPLLWSGGAGGMVVYRLDDQGRIVHQWVTGGAVPRPSSPSE